MNYVPITLLLLRGSRKRAIVVPIERREISPTSCSKSCVHSTFAGDAESGVDSESRYTRVRKRQ